VLKLARTNLEAHYYMARQPCTCGAVGFTGAGLHLRNGRAPLRPAPAGQRD
jgi:hypothetical protein